jgi:hypothetical protein
MRNYYLAIILTVLSTNFLYSQFSSRKAILYDEETSILTDLDGNGTLDILCALGKKNEIAWFPNSGIWDFSEKRVISIFTYNAKSVVSGDIDGDGDMDVLSASSDDNRIASYSNNGNGEFSDQQIISTDVGEAYNVYLNDLDLDGDLDVIASAFSPNELCWFENDGFGNFSDKIVLRTGTYLYRQHEVTFLDVDLDGDKDILFADQKYTNDNNIMTLHLLKNSGQANFEIVNIPYETCDAESYDQQLTCSFFDWNNDGLRDIIAKGYACSILVYYNLGNGSFNPVGEVISSTSNYTFNHISIFDFDNDGSNDFMGHSEPSAHILSQNGGQFSFQQIEYSILGFPKKCQIVDINNDGWLDITYPGDPRGKNYYHLNLNGTGWELHEGAQNFSWDTADLMSSGDINNDNRIDIVLSVQDPNNGINVGWLENLGEDQFKGQIICGSNFNNNPPNDVIIGDFTDNPNGYHQVYCEGDLIHYPFSGEFPAGCPDGVDQHYEQSLDADMDQDGDLDIVSIRPYGISLATNNGNGNFAESTLYSWTGTFGNEYVYIQLADFDNDTWLDVGYSYHYLNGLSDQNLKFGYLKNNETSYQNLVLYDYGSSPGSTALNDRPTRFADIDGDSDIDIVHSYETDNGIPTVEILLNQGDLSFVPAPSLTLSCDETINAVIIELVDVDSDSDLDLLLFGSSVTLPMYVSTNNGSGSFAPCTEMLSEFHIRREATGDSFSALTWVDMDQDGDKDLMEGPNYFSRELYWHENFGGSTYHISGYFLLDENDNGIADDFDTPVTWFPVFNPTQNTFSFSDENGYYESSAQAGEQSVLISSIPEGWEINNGISAYNINLTQEQPVSDNNNFLISPTSPLTSASASIVGEESQCNTFVDYHFNIQNTGNTIINGYRSIQIDPLCEVISTSPEPDSIVNNQFYFSVENLSYFQSQDILFELQMPSFEAIGNNLEFYLNLFGSTGEGYVLIESSELVQPLVCSYDPNDKQELTGVGEEHYITGTDYLEYLIRFQNTGTDTAEVVTIVDNLSGLLDYSSLEIITSSHDFECHIEADGQCLFVFNNIMLPDSFVNEPASHGYIKFRIKPISNLPHGTVISNHCEIYFDFNPPILTNSTYNKIYDCSLFNASFADESISACIGIPLDLDYTMEFADEILWYLDQEPVESPISSTTGMHWFKLVVSNDLCGMRSDSVLLVVNELPLAEITSSYDTDFCAGDTLVLESNITNSFWYANNEFLGEGNDFDITEGGTYVLKTLENGCWSVPDSITLIEHAAPLAIISAEEDVICGDEPISISSASGTNISWFLGNSLIGNNQEIIISEAGSYVLVVEGAFCNPASDTLEIIEGTVPELGLTLEDFSFCSNDSAVFFGNPLLNYEWTFNNSFYSIEDTISIHDSGYLSAIADNGLCTVASDTVFIESIFIPAPEISTSEITWCAEDSLHIGALSGSLLQCFQLIGEDSVLVGISDSIWVNQSGTYVFSHLSLGCESAPTNLQVNEVYVPIPVISEGENGLETENMSGYTYQWYLNDTPIEGANTAILNPDLAGFYTVSIEDINGCSSTSLEFYFAALSELKTNVISAFPNPTHDLLWLNGLTSSRYTIDVFNSMGEKVIHSISTLPLSMKSLSPGLYLLGITESKNYVVITITVE